MEFINSMTPKELSILANAIAIELAECRSADEINVLGNFIVAVGSLLLTIAAQEQNLQSIQDKQKEMQDGRKNKKKI